MLTQKQIKHKIQRLTKVEEALNNKHEGNEKLYTYYAGWDLGYVQGQLSILEELLDES